MKKTLSTDSASVLTKNPRLAILYSTADHDARHRRRRVSLTSWPPPLGPKHGHDQAPRAAELGRPADRQSVTCGRRRGLGRRRPPQRPHHLVLDLGRLVRDPCRARAG